MLEKQEGNLLLNFMDSYWPEEEVKTYSEIMDWIAGIHEDWPDNIDLFFYSIAEETDTGIISDRVKSMIQEMLISLLEDMGVFVSEDYELSNSVLYQIHRELVLLDSNEQVDFMLSILSSDQDEVVTFYEVMNVCGGLAIDEEVFLTHISRILPDTKAKLVEYLMKKKQVETVEETEYDVRQMALEVKRFIEVLNDDSFLVLDLLKNGLNPGMRFRDYMNLYGSEVLAEDMGFKDQAYNIYLFALISQDGYKDKAMLIEREIENFIPNALDADAMIRAAREIQSKVQLVKGV